MSTSSEPILIMPIEEEMLKKPEIEPRNNKVTNFAGAADVNKLIKYKGLIQREWHEVKVAPPSEVMHNAFTIDSEFQKYSWNPCTGYTVGDTKDVAMAMSDIVLGLQANASFRTFETNDFGIFYSSYAVVILNCSDNMRINFKLKDNCPQGMILCFEYSGPCHPKTPHVPVEPKKLSTGSIISIVTDPLTRFLKSNHRQEVAMRVFKNKIQNLT
ncbi:Hypothetical predicted protein [Octopus vulgaris]|uniref:Uncharacterized protein n=1 Tax=Octopus vulgaris TaxID=6645 RepID=A0AA36AGX6_OCTVU|nr:Hypothetical predicted protein [Octopus vulgaris]